MIIKPCCRAWLTDKIYDESPSAAAVVNGRPANGTIEWTLQTTGQTYKEWEAETLNGLRLRSRTKHRLSFSIITNLLTASI